MSRSLNPETDGWKEEKPLPMLTSCFGWYLTGSFKWSRYTSNYIMWGSLCLIVYHHPYWQKARDEPAASAKSSFLSVGTTTLHYFISLFTCQKVFFFTPEHPRWNPWDHKVVINIVAHIVKRAAFHWRIQDTRTHSRIICHPYCFRSSWEMVWFIQSHHLLNSTESAHSHYSRL